ncbi:hypothetical protein Enr10x_20700 [Gimesia panareensis]|uniref:Leucine Rich repeats (2 copies) n=1 Tax=Gimesia panareensis TaxID=2527978 RepID=A0A517Q549_9PLAN|nr:hypothetical protein [Gimesia panareensis]QDT26760.1 hypothetical protein Enr10x_20700 [Gimesia panareensis]
MKTSYALNRHFRHIIIPLILVAFLFQLKDWVIILLVLWISVELFRVSKRYGKKGKVAFFSGAAVLLLLLGIQIYRGLGYLEVARRVTELGASLASVSGEFIPGPVNYISLGEGVGDAELENIVALEGLDHVETVIASGTPITDDGLFLLARFSHLERLTIINCPQISQEAIDALQQELPNCSILVMTDQ